MTQRSYFGNQNSILRSVVPLAMFTFLALGLPGLFVIESPEPTPRSWMAELNRTVENKIWSLATGERLRFASIAYLVIGHIAFILAIYLILLEDVWVDLCAQIGHIETHTIRYCVKHLS